MTPLPLGPAAGRPAVFLDRDGTIVEDVEFLVRPAQLRLIPGAAAAIRRLNQADILAVVVTNQSMIARGMASERDLATIHQCLRDLLADEGAQIDGFYYCPHHPEIGATPYRGTCDCRKPRPGLLRQAARERGIDLAASAMIGDSLRDLEAGAAAGCTTLILVRTGHGASEEARGSTTTPSRPWRVCDDLAGAIDGLLTDWSRTGRMPAKVGPTPPLRPSR